MAALIPGGGLVLRATEFEYGKTDAIVANGFDSPPGWSWSFSPIGETPGSSREGVNISITPDGWKLVIDYLGEELLFPIKTIEAISDRQEVHVAKHWANVPDMNSFRDIYKLEEDHKNWCEWSLSVVARGTESGMPAVAAGDYVVRVYADYNNSRDILRNELDKRRR